jgi:MerR family redox-sensitive transcriptional activator SoxR
LTIGHVAKATGIPASSIRYYEAAGIIAKAPRKNGMRQYGREAVDELKALRVYRATGIPIRGLRAIATQPRGTSARASVWAEVLRARIDDLDAWMREAQKTKGLLEQVIACRCQGKREHCTVMRAADAL